MEIKERKIVDGVEALEETLANVRAAQKKFAAYSQEQVDKIFLAAASAANKARIPLAKMAVEETGMGVVEDKVIKNNYASEYIYNAYKNTKTCGVIEEDKAYGVKKIAEPIGVIAAVIPTTNPTSTAIFKCLIALKTRNAIIISPHPRAKQCTIAAAKLVLDAAVAAGAPEGIIEWIDVPSLDMTNLVMKEADIILSDISEGMLRDARRAIGAKDGRFSYEVFDCQHIPFADGSFDLVIANHVLFYCEDIRRVCGEVRRVLRPDGRFLCSAYGQEHMKEVSLLVQGFDDRIVLSADKLYDRFGKENGAGILEEYFPVCRWKMYEDQLIVPEPEPLISYVLSCHGNQGQYITERYKEFRSYVKRKTDKGFRITKEAGAFLCRI